MKHYYLKALTLLLCLIIGITTHAHDFAAQNSDGVTIYYNITSSTDLTCEVTYQGKYSYSSDEYIGNITIPKTVTYNGTTYSVTSIGEDAFGHCEKLNSVIIPNSVISIGEEAFAGCWELNSVIIPNSVISIGEYAFSACYGLTSVTIPNSVTDIGSSAFNNCTSLKELCIEDGESTLSLGYNDLDHEGLFYDCPLETLYLGRNLSYSTKAYYGYSPFYNKNTLKSVTIGNSVTSIGDYAFSGCTGLINITIPNSVTSIGGAAFSGCTGLTSVVFNAENCETTGAFSGCTSLSNITIGENVKTIPSYAFFECTGLTSISIPNSVTSIGYGAFNNCAELTSIVVESGNVKYDSRGNCNAIIETATNTLIAGCKNTIIPNSVVSIGGGAFSGCTGLINITIPNSVTNISSYAFSGCTGLSRINSIKSSPTKLMFEISNNTDYQSYVEINDKYYNTKDKKIEVSDLKPNMSYYYEFGLIINNIYCYITQSNSTTSQFNVEIEGESGVCSIYTKGSYNDENIEIIGLKLSLNNDDIEYDNLNEKTFTNLDPNTNYTVYYSVNTKEGGVYSTSKTFTTGALTWSNAEYQATSTTSARLMTETNCDATEGTGFEWRRYGAPENLKPNAVACPVVDGMLVGSLRNLNSEAYYEFRPYYTSSSGKTYCGEWTALFTGDANVYFEPEVRTYEDVQLSQNTVVLKGYALAGTDEITSQGFEYWKSSNQPSAKAQLNAVLDSKTVTADGISMSALIENLDYGTTYCYRAFATTDKGTVYGDTMEFTTDNEPSGIEETIVDGSEDAPVEYYNLQGVRVANPERGLYIKRQGGKTTKVVL